MVNSSPRTRRTAPTQRFDPVQLIEFGRFFAAEVREGKYPFIDYDEKHRWHQRIYRDQRLDVWLISWLPTQGTQLHDHGGSSGSFTVISGALTEAVCSGPGRMQDLERTSGDSVGFAQHYIHDVLNLSEEPAISVHTYSPPLTSMTYYDLAGGSLVPIRTLATDDPESDVAVAS